MRRIEVTLSDCIFLLAASVLGPMVVPEEVETTVGRLILNAGVSPIVSAEV